MIFMGITGRRCRVAKEDASSEAVEELKTLEVKSYHVRSCNEMWIYTPKMNEQFWYDLIAAYIGVILIIKANSVNSLF